ncbi:EF-hand domain-containing protein [Sphingomonas glacialis]|uniref:Signal transduction protein n=1 Tax=Sphingomonas glacialis TaxID=658225 RepID=A0A502FT96_9SPHN|nr:signal transduction protein [Sphingomonas glacialis]TPG52609.1 signal transduction protein [Sphingomonas glacialis]
MKNMSMMLLGRTAFMVVALTPTAACAQRVGQGTPAKQENAATEAGVSLSTYQARHARKLLAADTNGDGNVSRAEFLAASKGGKADPAKRFAKLDANGDGTLDKSEIDATLSRRFKRLDTNGDGLLSADERAAAHARKGKDAGDGSES